MSLEKVYAKVKVKPWLRRFRNDYERGKSEGFRVRRQDTVLKVRRPLLLLLRRELLHKIQAILQGIRLGQRST